MIQVLWDNDLGHGVWAFGEGRAPDGGPWPEVYTALILSLFTEAQAAPDDVLPPGASDRGGWYGQPDFGCKWWLRTRLPRNDATLDILKTDAEAAAGWLIDDGVCDSIDFAMSWVAGAYWGVVITVTRGRVRHQYDFAWQG